MKLATIRFSGEELAAVVTEEGLLTIRSINQRMDHQWPEDLFSLLKSGKLDELNQWVRTNHSQFEKDLILFGHADYAPLYRHPSKIWGIGLNYKEHASDLDEMVPHTEPASFMKPDTTIIGCHDPIEIPLQSSRTTAEAELGVIIGKTCKNVSVEEAPHVIAGYTTIIDMTAEDILQQNPRYLTRSKSFDTFFSFGPHLWTTDELDDLFEVEVATIINGSVHRKNKVKHMMFDPYFLVSFHSRVMTLLPGDIISTGTPGAAVIKDGDLVECHIQGFEPLKNPVVDLKKKKG
ncbi:2-keto-4-pentenoate hydratase/2-oxohepta-3-ene-1,7-dioic acid hydratase in catechol pathway [Melghiribacillus thermohalophilus]|uniref:2-keto-4-pentenoate hydratase/2-oxohepta-3-ene-1,7-dioic acid hydratase in catechol pathway n=1 Tax=Melghiribacillus thermohalophilus TaxID=1324956 RepID=A0A4R3MVC4_9BACI|nr:fumarylacetoacetate hydrolase family protein [Melghiribacillus thermohalophilus]TCT18278.1 2-keto-4-pentenoate hydratase/2-oxohepta-3-ene-1,7-dioic acid hydratase in catechol pathway [Melghiribacillus thermohalophilus]